MCIMLRYLLIFIVVLGICEETVIASQADTFSSIAVENKPSIQVYPSNQKPHVAYNGYSIPTYPDYVPVKSFSNVKSNEQARSSVATTTEIPRKSWPSRIIKSLVPLSNYALLFGEKMLMYAFSLFVIVTVSLGLTTFICTFTPLCNPSFHGIDVAKTRIAELAKPYITPENLNKGTDIIGRAIDTFHKIQNDFKTNAGLQKSIRGDIVSISASMERKRRR